MTALNVFGQFIHLLRLMIFRDAISLILYLKFHILFKRIEWKNDVLVKQFDRVVGRHQSKPAIIYHGKRYSFLDLYYLSNKIANWLEMSLQLGTPHSPENVTEHKNGKQSLTTNGAKGKRSKHKPKPLLPETTPPQCTPDTNQIGLFLGNIPELVAFLIGVSRVRATSVLFNTNHRRDTLVNAFRATSCRVVVFEAKYLDVIREVASQLPDIRFFMYDRSQSHPGPVSEHNTPNSPTANVPLTSDLNRRYLKYYGVSRDDLHNNVPVENFAPILNQYPTTLVQKPYRYQLEDSVTYLFTSGTTGGNIKATPVNNVRFIVGFLSQSHAFGITAEDNIYIPLPCYHSFPGVVGLSRCLLGGSTVTLADKFSASRFWKDCKENKCTVALYIGETCRYLLAQPVSLEENQHSIRMMLGLGLKKEIWAEFQKRFNIAKISEFYGSSEGNVQIYNIDGTEGSCGFIPYYFGPLTRFLFPIHLIKVDPVTLEPVRKKNGLCQLARPGEVGILVGEIRDTMSFTKFLGYTSTEETSKKIIRNILNEGDYAFVSGDLMELDFYGNLYFKDRTGDTFRWKGENVSTTEIESIAGKYLNHAKCTVYGVTVPKCDGRAGMIAIQWTDNETEPDLAKMYKQVKSNVPEYAIPKFVRLTGNIETTSTHKVIKYRLREQGIDLPKTSPDRLYYFDRQTDGYQPLNDEVYGKIQQGLIKL